MNIKKFSKWQKWEVRDLLESINYPGVYSIAISEIELSGKTFRLIKEIKYFGMTNAHSGLKGRLKQFDNTIKGKKGHGGGHRFRYKHPEYKTLIKKLYVSINPQICDTKHFSPEDLVKMGDVASFEYQCFAEYVKVHNGLPEFNDKIISPKK